MTEDYLHYTWQYRLYNRPELSTTSGQQLVVIQPGIHNHHGGPDFSNARLKIGDQIWSGHVEIHLKSSDWHKHGHTDDEHYKNVILHVVFNNDREIYLHQPGDLPVFDVSTYLIGNQWERYQQWLQNKSWIPCQQVLPSVDQLTWTAWKDRLLIERLEKKSEAFMDQFTKTGGDWSEVFYRKLARNFGFKVNADAMERLAENLPQSILAKHKSDPFQIEALLFGQAGMLQEIFADEYPRDLQKEYKFLCHKYGMKEMNASAWNFGRLRPPNFPTIRLAQFSALICKSEHLFTQLLEEDSPENILRLFDGEPHEYWRHHYRFDAQTVAEPVVKSTLKKQSTSKKMGVDSIHNIMINTVAVTLFAYGKYHTDQNQIDKALKIFEICNVEHNSILDNWVRLGVKCHHAGDSQSLLQLFNVYCSARKCLQCQIGLKLLKNEK